MITEKVIDTLYKKYSKKPSDPYGLDIPLLFEGVNEIHGLEFNENGELAIGSIPGESPFHSIDIHRVHAIVPFEEWVAIVLHSTIIFLNRKSTKTYIHIKALQRSFMQKLSSVFSKA